MKKFGKRVSLFMAMAILTTAIATYKSPTQYALLGIQNNIPEVTEPLWVKDTEVTQSSYTTYVAAIGEDGTIYEVAGDKLIALDEKGKEKWRFQCADGIREVKIGSHHTIYIGGRTLYAINAENGQENWKNANSDIITSMTLGSDGTIYYGTADSKISAFSPEGNKKWEVPLVEQKDLMPKYSLEMAVSQMAVSKDNHLLFKLNNKIYVMDAKGNVNNEIASIGKILSFAISPDDIIYARTKDTNKLSAIYLDGKVKWEHPLENQKIGETILLEEGTPTIGADGVIYFEDNRKLYAVNPEGTIKWKVSLYGNIFRKPVIGPDGNIYIKVNNGIIWAISPSGKVLWQYHSFPGADELPAISKDSTVYVGTQGALRALKYISNNTQVENTATPTLLPAITPTSTPAMSPSPPPSTPTVRTGIHITIDGKVLPLDVPPRLEKGRILVPFRSIFDALGSVVKWDEKSKTVTGAKGNVTIVFKLGTTYAKANGIVKKLDVPPMIENGRILIPARFVSEVLGCEVNWEKNTKTVAIKTKK